MDDIVFPTTITLSQAQVDKAKGAVVTALQCAEDCMSIGPITADSVHDAAKNILSRWRIDRLPILASTVSRAHRFALHEAVRRLDSEAAIEGDGETETMYFPAPRCVDVEELLATYAKAHPRILHYRAEADEYYL